MNEVAEFLTGWTISDAIGKSLAEVFSIVNEETLKPCEDPVRKVLKTGRVVGLANSTLLIARDGSRRMIADSAAPIRDRDAVIIGVVLVFRDMTESKKMEHGSIQFFEFRIIDRL